MAWLWWLAAALLLAVVEVFTLDFVLIMLAGGALAASVAAALGASFVWQVVVFAVVSTVLLLTCRRWLLRRFRHDVPKIATNADALVGRDAVTLLAITPTSGRVKLHGEVWSARTAPAVPPIPPGAVVRVVRIDGATAVVEPERAPTADNHRTNG